MPSLDFWLSDPQELQKRQPQQRRTPADTKSRSQAVPVGENASESKNVRGKIRMDTLHCLGSVGIAAGGGGADPPSSLTSWLSLTPMAGAGHDDR